MNQDLSIIQLILHASVVVQLVIALLMAISIASWAAIFRKYFALKRVRSLNDEFEGDFWSGTSLNELAAAAKKNDPHAGPMQRIFASGMREYQKLRERRIDDSSALLDGARRAMRASFQRVMDVVETNLSFLASVHRFSRYDASYIGYSSSWHCRSIGCHCHWFVCSDSCRGGLQPVCTRH